MYICICQSVSEKAIHEAVEAGVRSFSELQACTGCSTCCGCCEPDARRVFERAIKDICVDAPRLAVA